MWRILYILHFWVLLSLPHLVAQTKPNSFQSLYFHQLNANSNIKLKNPVISMGFVSNDGNLYLGGEGGLYLFNGSAIKSYLHNPKVKNSICDNYIINIIEDKHKNFWIGTQNGIAYFDRNTETFTNYQQLQTEVDIPPNFYAFPFYIDQNEQVWVYISGNVFKLNPKEKKLTYVAAFSNGKIFVNEPFYKNTFKVIGNKYSGFCEMHIVNGQKVFQKNYLHTLKDSLKCVVTKAKWISDSTAWITSNIGLIKFNSNTQEVQQYRPSKTPNQNALTSLNYLPQNKELLFVSSMNNGLYVFNTTENKFVQHFKHDPLDNNSIGANHIQDVLCDQNNNVFLVLPNVGLSYCNTLQGQFNKQLNKKELIKYNFLDNKVQTLTSTADSQLIIIGTANNGLLMYNFAKQKIVQHIPFLEGVKIVKHIDSNQYLVVTNSNVVYSLQHRNNTWHTSKLMLNLSNIETPEINIQDLFVQNDLILFATNYGLSTCVLSKNMYTLYFNKEVSENVHWNNFARIILVNDTSFLLQALSTNLYLVNNKNRQQKVIKEIARTPYQINDGVFWNQKIILATSLGLKEYDIQNTQLTDIPFVLDYCVGIISKNNNLWITTKNGLLQYQPINGSYFKFLKEDGLQDNVFNNGTLITHNAYIIAGGMNGINVFTPQKIHNQTIQYAATINSIKINEQAIPFSNLINNPFQALKLAYNQNNLTIDIAPLVFINNEDTKIYYQLYGVDNNRNALSGQNTITYANLKPGEYTLVVSGNQDIGVKTLKIIIDTPFWKTTWFRVVAIIFILAIIGALIAGYIYWIKRSQIKDLRIVITSQEKERERIARDLHDLFGARLSTLKLYMQTLNKNNPTSIATLTSSATSMIDNAISELRHLLFDLSPKSLSENGLVAAVDDLVHNLEKITKQTIHTDFVTYQHQLGHKRELSIYRIIQELLNNTIKYAEATVIHISLVKNGNDMIFMYEDNGIGFDKEKIEYGYGLHNIQLHTKAMMGELTIDAMPQKGMQVIITLPIKL